MSKIFLRHTLTKKIIDILILYLYTFSLYENASQSGGKRKGIVLICQTLYCSDMPNVVSAIDGTSHEIQIPFNEPQQQFENTIVSIPR